MFSVGAFMVEPGLPGQELSLAGTIPIMDEKKRRKHQNQRAPALFIKYIV